MTNEEVFALIVELRGGVPERCDFCQHVFDEDHWPIPDEGGEWSCSACWTRWEQEDKDRQSLGIRNEE